MKKNRIKLIAFLLALSIDASSLSGCSEELSDIDSEKEVITLNFSTSEQTIVADREIREEEVVEPVTEIPDTITKVICTTNQTTLTIPEYFSTNDIEETKEIDADICFNVYEESDLAYLVKTEDTIGYIKKSDALELSGTFVIVDISDQELKLYQNNEIILTSPVVTGGKRTPSDEGLFYIYDISTNRYLVGPGYKSYVDVMMKYNNGEGLHDAEYHTDDNGFQHGWRESSEFGGETYLTDGSHGCVNMPHDAALAVYEEVEIGTPVLVKK